MEDQKPEAAPEAAPVFEQDYAPPAPSRTGETVADVNGNTMISYYEEGQRYAAVGANEADARKLLDENPAFCRVPST